MRLGSAIGFFVALSMIAIFLQFTVLPVAGKSESKSSDSLLDSLKELEDSLKGLGDSLKELDDLLKGKKSDKQEDQQPAETPGDKGSKPDDKKPTDLGMNSGQGNVSEKELEPGRKFGLRTNLNASDRVYIRLSDDGTEDTSGLAAGDRQWAKPSAEMLSPIPDIPSMKIIPPLNINDMTTAQYNGAVSTAMQAMLELMGELTEEEEAKFSAKWAPLFAFPTVEIVEYLNKLNPLLAEFLSLRGAMASACVEFDAAWEEAVLATSYESEEGAEEALSLAAMQRDYMLSLHARMVQVARAIQELGNPPSPIEAQERARRRHKEALDVAANMLPRVIVTPANGTVEEGKPYQLTAKVQNVSGKVTINWAFGDGTVVTNAPANVSHTYKKTGNFAIRAVVYDASKKKIAEGNAQVSVGAKMEGVYVLADTKVEEIPWPNQGDAPGWDDEGSPYYNCKIAWEHSENAAACKMYREKDFCNYFKFAWDKPPAKLIRGKEVPLNISIEALQGASYNEGYAEFEISFQGDWDLESDFRGLLLWSNEVKQGNRKVQRTAVLRVTPHSKNNFVGIELKMVQSQYIVKKTYTYKLDENATADSVASTSTKIEVEKESPEKAAQRLREETVGFHKANIAIIEGHLAKDRAELAKETDPERRATLELRIIHKMSDLQAEKDLIASLQTGRYVHTRTPFDDYAQAQFVQNIVDNQRKMEAFQRSSAALYRLAGMLPPEEGRQAREFVDKQLTADVRAKMDQETVKKIASALDNKVQGYYQGEAAKSEERAAWANMGLEASQNLKSAADMGMMACSMMGGRPLHILYLSTTGYIEGGPVEAVLNTAATFGTAAYSSAEAFKGYREGGVQAAVTRGATAFVTAKAIEYGISKIMQGVKPAPNKPTVKEQFELAKFKQARADGESLVRDFHRTQLQLEAAAARGASAQELTSMQGQLRDKAAAINSSMHAKNFLKYKGELHAQRAYNAHMNSIHAEVEARFHNVMTRQGWNRQQLMEFRNAASAGSVGMDYDIGLSESAAMNLLKNGRKGTVRQWQDDAQNAWGQAYKQVTNRSADRAWENVTSSVHAESYKDLAWLGSDKSMVSKAWAQQSADVTRYKAWHMLNDSSLSRMEGLQEVSRGTAKDISTKLQPLLDNAKPANDASVKALANAKNHWKKVQETLASFGNNDIDPISAERKIREITGGKSIPEVVEDMGTLMQSLVMSIGK